MNFFTKLFNHQQEPGDSITITTYTTQGLHPENKNIIPGKYGSWMEYYIFLISNGFNLNNKYILYYHPNEQIRIEVDYMKDKALKEITSFLLRENNINVRDVFNRLIV